MGKSYLDDEIFYARQEGATEAMRTLARAVAKFAPDLGLQLVARFKEADGALDEFVKALSQAAPK